jgi:FkbM family methyltransferase
MTASAMPLARNLAPHFLVRAAEWYRRFTRIGVAAEIAPGLTLSSTAREALLQSRIEHLPPKIRADLKHVVDIGSNEGQWLMALLRFADIQQIDAIEPNPDAFLRLESNLRNRSGVRLHQCALGDRKYLGELNIPASSDLASLLNPAETLHEFYPFSATSKQVKVHVETLDDLLPGTASIDLLKIDVQGFEVPVLQGSRNLLSRTRALMIEANFVSHYVGDATFSTLDTMLTAEFGFALWDISPPHRGAGGRALWSDAIYVNRRYN